VVMFILPSLCHFFLSFEARKQRVLGLSRRWRWRWRWTCSCRCRLKCGRLFLDSLFVLLQELYLFLLPMGVRCRFLGLAMSIPALSCPCSPLSSLLYSPTPLPFSETQ